MKPVRYVCLKGDDRSSVQKIIDELLMTVYNTKSKDVPFEKVVPETLIVEVRATRLGRTEILRMINVNRTVKK